MVKITKPGQKEFHGFCKWCGCEFTYEISDLTLSATSDKVSCPTCGKDYHHPSLVQDPTLPGGIGYRGLQDITWPSNTIPCTPDMTKTDPCAGCVWRENLLRDGLYIGDTPCTWCNKNKFSCNISGSSILQSGPYPEAHLADTLSSVSSTSSSCNTGTTATIHLDAITTTDQVDRDYVNEKIQEAYTASGCSALNKCEACGVTEGKNSCHNDSKCSGNRNCKGKQ